MCRFKTQTDDNLDIAMTLGAPGNYKEKYLSALEDQERMEKQFELQMEYLRKTVVNLGAAAQGLDKTLDAEMMALRERMRGAKGAQVVEQMDRVQRAVAAFEQNRDNENATAARAMAELLEQYLSLKIPNDLKEKLTKLSGGIKKSLVSYRVYPAVLAEVVKLQQQALDAAAEEPTSFWQRLRPGRQVKPVDALAQTPVETPSTFTVPNTVDKSEEQPDSPEANVIDHTTECQFARPTLHQDEDSYPQVAERICATLKELIEKIQPNEVVQHRFEIVQKRIERGMDWFAFAVTLEDIRDILLLRYLDVDHEFSDYLQQINRELLNITEELGLAMQCESQQNAAIGSFTDVVNNQMQCLQTSMESSQNLDQLKSEVQTHVKTIQTALQRYQNSKPESSDQGSLTEQLRLLVERVKSIENESQETKKLLEEERYKATHDVLTKLPNREAYNERAFHELQRFKRYGHPLTIAVCDVDYFKRINDTHGHQVGDKVLKLLAGILTNRLRQVDFIARYGGEEFVILLPETSEQAALSVLDKIRAAIGKSAFRFKEQALTISISFGISAFLPDDSVESCFARADEALYQAKKQGRNCCVVASHRQQPPHLELCK